MREYELQSIEDEIMKWINECKLVVISSGAANDNIVTYQSITVKTPRSMKRKVEFTTTHCIFPEIITLDQYDHVELEPWTNPDNGSQLLEIHVR